MECTDKIVFTFTIWQILNNFFLLEVTVINLFAKNLGLRDLCDYFAGPFLIAQTN